MYVTPYKDPFMVRPLPAVVVRASRGDLPAPLHTFDKSSSNNVWTISQSYSRLGVIGDILTDTPILNIVDQLGIVLNRFTTNLFFDMPLTHINGRLVTNDELIMTLPTMASLCGPGAAVKLARADVARAVINNPSTNIQWLPKNNWIRIGTIYGPRGFGFKFGAHADYLKGRSKDYIWLNQMVRRNLGHWYWFRF